MRPHLLAIVLSLGAVAVPTLADSEKTRRAVTLESSLARYVISANGRTTGFRDKRTGKEYCAAARPFPVARKGKASHASTRCTYKDGRLTVEFGTSGVSAVFRSQAKGRYFVFELVSISDPAVEELSFVNLPVTLSQSVSSMSGVATGEDFAAAIRGCNLQTRARVAGRPVVLTARCYRTYGLVGAKAAVTGCPPKDVRSVLQEIVRGEGLPNSPLGGPFAMDAPENRGSYVFAAVSESNVDDWIALACKAGLRQIHFHPWWQSMGHYEPRRSLFRRGLKGVKAAVDKIHAAGMKAGMHTLTGCISPHDAWVRPVPDRRLAVDATYTLASDVDAKGATIPTLEQPGQFDTVWTYGGHGNVVRIDDELIHFTALSRDKPYAFAACKRGAFGTKPSAHKAGSDVRHLFVRYGCFQPAENSTLVDEIAERLARVFNTCGFDMIYMDGAEGMIGGWHGVAKMRLAIFRKLKRRVLVEASEWGTESWLFHSRLGAWDYPNWGLKAFIDSHCHQTEQYRRLHLLPAQLGWWAIFGPNRHHPAERPDELEYLCVKSLALDAPMSFQALRPGANPPNARQDEYLAMLGRYERLRLSGKVPPDVRRRLAEPGREFRLRQGPKGRWQFVPTDYLAHKVTDVAGPSARWTIRNRHAPQPVRLRIEALYSVEPYDSADAVVLADFVGNREFSVRRVAKGVACTLSPETKDVKAGGRSGRLTATSKAATRRGAWAQVGKRFNPHADISPHDAIGVWVHGDGGGHVLNVQLTTPRQYYRALSEHYVPTDFVGWQYVELLFRERDADQFARYAWPYPGHYYVYRAPLVRNHVDGLNLYLNELRPGKTTSCLLSPIKALRTRKVKLRNAAVTVGRRRITFPVSIPSGGYIEFDSMTDCRLYDDRGALVQEVRPRGDAPVLTAGENHVAFTCEGPKGVRARAQVTVITCGRPFGPDADRARP